MSPQMRLRTGTGRGTAYVVIVGLMALLSCLTLPAIAGVDMRLLLPTLATAAVVLIAVGILRVRLGDSLLIDLGFLYLCVLLVYTVVPGLGLMSQGLSADSPLSQLGPQAPQLGAELWRQTLFAVSFAVGYILLRGRATLRVSADDEARQIDGGDEPRKIDGGAILAVALIIAVCMLVLSLLSAPVHSYWDNYTRYDHLPSALRKLTSVAVRLKEGLYPILLVILFRNYRARKWLVVGVVCGLSIYEVSYSFGARIETLIILLQAFCLYGIFVKPVPIRKAVVGFVILSVAFAVIEALRVEAFNIGRTKELFATSQAGWVAGEFGSVFFPGFQLYAARAARTLPPHQWPMLFYDLLALIPFGGFQQWNPMHWYYRYYFPGSVVAPFTLGPIANSAVWFGEIGLVVRGLVNGLFFAWIVRWFVRRKKHWWAVVTYVFVYSTCVLTLKYSVFHDGSMVMKTLLPAMLVLVLIRGTLVSLGRSTKPLGASAQTPSLR